MDSVVIMSASDLNKLVNQNILVEQEKLVLYSCWPFTFSATKTDRFVVTADRITGRDVKWREVDE